VVNQRIKQSFILL